ncbi:MAG: hypothetical protein ACYTGZ_17115 [Planctomycetota bacterium]
MRGVLVLAAVALACKSPELNARQLESARRQIHVRLVQLPGELQLSNDQSRRVRPVLKSTREEILRLVIRGRRGETDLRKASTLRKELRAIRGGTLEQLKPILSGQQMGVLREAYRDVDKILRDAHK